MPALALLFVLNVILLGIFPSTTVRYIWSIGLFLFAIPCVIMNTGIPVCWYYNKWIRKQEINLGSRVPFVGSICLFLGVLLLPADLPANRFLLACLVACFDISIIDVPLFWIIWLLRGRPELDTDQEQIDKSES